MEGNKIKQNNTKESKRLALHYMVTLVDVARESFLILDHSLRVISANPTFYEVFQVLPEETVDRLLYELGNGQWNISELKGLLEKILPAKKVVKNYKVSHTFQTIGRKTMLLNARQIDTVQLIILAIEDITVQEELEKKIIEYTEELEIKVAERTEKLASQIKKLEDLNKTMVGRELKMVELKKEIKSLEKQIKNGNGKNGNKRNGLSRLNYDRAGNNNHKNGR